MASNSSKLNRRELLAGVSVGTSLVYATPAFAAKTETNSSKKLAGKSVLITGCSKGFGYASSLHLARNGAKVIASMRNLKGGKRHEAQKLLDTAADEKLDVKVVEIDVTDTALVTSGVTQAIEYVGGPLDTLVNNAGMFTPAPFELHDEQSLRDHFETNVLGYHRVSNAVLPGMRASGSGLIIAISSQLGRITRPTNGMYCSTKFAVEAMFEAFAYEMAPLGIDVTIIQPGPYRGTNLMNKGFADFVKLEEKSSPELLKAYTPHRKVVHGDYNPQTLAKEVVDNILDIPNSIARLMALASGKRPLRQVVHPTFRVAEPVNAMLANVQSRALANSPYAEWHRTVKEL